MPTSSRENKRFMQEFAAEHEVKTVLDIGAGAGTYYDFLHEQVDYLDAVEVWDKYIARYKLRDKYRKVYDIDVRGFEAEDTYDLSTAGDVLEHVYPQEAVKIFQYLRSISKYVMVSVPIVVYPQGKLFGNHHEMHLIEDALKELIPLLGEPYLENRYKITGTFIYKGELA